MIAIASHQATCRASPSLAVSADLSAKDACKFESQTFAACAPSSMHSGQNSFAEFTKLYGRFEATQRLVESSKTTADVDSLGRTAGATNAVDIQKVVDVLLRDARTALQSSQEPNAQHLLEQVMQLHRRVYDSATTTTSSSSSPSALLDSSGGSSINSSTFTRSSSSSTHPAAQPHQQTTLQPPQAMIPQQPQPSDLQALQGRLLAIRKLLEGPHGKLDDLIMQLLCQLFVDAEVVWKAKRDHAVQGFMEEIAAVALCLDGVIARPDCGGDYGDKELRRYSATAAAVLAGGGGGSSSSPLDQQQQATRCASAGGSPLTFPSTAHDCYRIAHVAAVGGSPVRRVLLAEDLPQQW